jgi:hypothetical protein
MSGLPRELRDWLASGPMAQLSAINPDGRPQVTVIWIGLDGDELVCGHIGWCLKLRQHPAGPAGRVVLRCAGGARTSPQLASSPNTSTRLGRSSSSSSSGATVTYIGSRRLLSDGVQDSRVARWSLRGLRCPRLAGG